MEDCAPCGRRSLDDGGVEGADAPSDGAALPDQGIGPCNFDVRLHSPQGFVQRPGGCAMATARVGEEDEDRRRASGGVREIADCVVWGMRPLWLPRPRSRRSA